MKRNHDFRSALVLGGAGFIGSNWAQWLLANTASRVHIFDNLSRPGVRHNLDRLQASAGNSGRLKITIGDIRNEKLVEQAVRQATEVYHCAAQVAVTTSVIDPALDFDVNLRGTFNVLEAIRRAGHKPFFLFTSTNKVYGNLGEPEVIAESSRYRWTNRAAVNEDQALDFHSPYGCSKGGADQYVRDYARIYGIPTVVFRMSCIAGPGQFGTEDQGWMAHFLYSALRGCPLVIYGDGKQVRDVLHVGDLMRAFELVRCTPAAHGQIFNVGGGEARTASLIELIEMIRNTTGRTPEFVTDDFRPGDQLIYISDHSKLTRLTGWKPEIDVPATLASMYQWWRGNRGLFQDPAASLAADAPAAMVPEAA
jgi:CDP-paratose 2-epimerase